MKFPRSGANLRLADEKARERIGVDAVRSVGPLRMIRRKVNRTAVPAGLRGASSANHLCTTEVEGNTVLQHFCQPITPPLMGKFGCLPTVKNPEKIPLICYS